MVPSFVPSAQPDILEEMTKEAKRLIGQNGEVDGGPRRRFVVKGHWKPSEDVKLRELVALQGPKNWNIISEQLPGRTGKSCRLRWVNQLDPRIKTTSFSREEEETLKAAHMVFGNQWSHIAKFFPGRTDNAIKNHWHVLTARRRKHFADVSSSSSSSGSFQRLSGDSTNGSSGSTSLPCMNIPDSVFRGEKITMSLVVSDDGGHCKNVMETNGGYMLETYTFMPPEAHFLGIVPPKNLNLNTATSHFTTITPPTFIDFLGIGN